MKKFNFIVADDEEIILNQYIEKVKNFDELRLIGTTASTDAALEMTREYQPDAVILDLEFHNGQGDGMRYLKQLPSLCLPHPPYILVATNNISPIVRDAVRKIGADYVITKTAEDYSPEKCMRHLLDVLETGVIRRNDAAEELEAKEKYRQTLKEKISTELDLIGISRRSKGRKYLQDAIEMLFENDYKRIHDIIAKNYGVTGASVERSMQGAINSAWEHTDTDSLLRHYTAYIRPDRGCPTLNEFIYYYRDKIKNNL